MRRHASAHHHDPGRPADGRGRSRVRWLFGGTALALALVAFGVARSGLLVSRTGPAGLPRSLVASAQSLRAEAEARLAQKPAVEGAAQQPRISTDLSNMLDKALEEAQRLDDAYVSV